METIYKENEISLMQDNKIVGKVIFILDKDELRLTQTIVNPEFRGQGIAGELMKLVVKEAKEKGLKIIPICSYAVSYFKKNNEYDYLLKN